jgi:gluconokinase
MVDVPVGHGVHPVRCGIIPAMAARDADVVLGADIGTTSTKVVAFDSQGEAHGHAEHSYPLDAPEPGQAVQDPETVADAVVAAIREAGAEASASGARLAGVSFSSAMHSLVGLDDDGRPLTPLLTWADTRAVAQAERLRAEDPELHDRTGTPVHPMSPLCKLAWYRETEAETFAAATRWCGIKELVLDRLTDRAPMDQSCASGTGLMATRTLDWDQAALAAAGIGAGALPELVGPQERLALAAGGAAQTGLAEGTVVVAGGGDGPLANLGVGAVHPGVAACSIGTSGALRLMVDEPRIDPGRRAFCYLLTPGRWVTGGAINNGGAVLEWAGRALAPDLGEHPEEELLALAGEVPAGSEGLVMLPYLLSERAPNWSAVPRGAYVGLTRDHGRGHLVRAAIEGVCLQLALVLGSMRDAGDEVREVRATGGFARSPLWRQMLTDALGMPVGFPAGSQGSAFGAALLGMEALEMIPSLEVAAELVKVDQQLEPDAADADVYAELLEVFAGLSGQLEPAFRALRVRDP